MAKKEYLTPEFTEIETEIKDAIVIGTGNGNEPDPGEPIGGEDVGAKGWGAPFNDDEPFNDEP